MIMPTTCNLCHETFDLPDGRRGQTVSTSNETICYACYKMQVAQKERIEKIRSAKETIEDSEYQIITSKQEIEQARGTIDSCKEDIIKSNSTLNGLNYIGQDDEYYTLVNEYF